MLRIIHVNFPRYARPPARAGLVHPETIVWPANHNKHETGTWAVAFFKVVWANFDFRDWLLPFSGMHLQLVKKPIVDLCTRQHWGDFGNDHELLREITVCKKKYFLKYSM